MRFLVLSAPVVALAMVLLALVGIRRAVRSEGGPDGPVSRRVRRVLVADSVVALVSLSGGIFFADGDVGTLPFFLSLLAASAAYAAALSTMVSVVVLARRGRVNSREWVVLAIASFACVVALGPWVAGFIGLCVGGWG